MELQGGKQDLDHKECINTSSQVTERRMLFMQLSIATSGFHSGSNDIIALKHSLHMLVNCIGTCREQFLVQTEQKRIETVPVLKPSEEDKQSYSNYKPGSK